MEQKGFGFVAIRSEERMRLVTVTKRADAPTPRRPDAPTPRRPDAPTRIRCLMAAVE